MSDRRPENPRPMNPKRTLVVYEEPRTVDGHYVPGSVLWDASPSDLVAAVRRGVESGTITGGKVRTLCREHHARYNDGAPGCEVWMAVKQGGGEPGPCQVEPFLLIPVGSEE